MGLQNIQLFVINYALKGLINVSSVCIRLGFS